MRKGILKVAFVLLFSLFVLTDVFAEPVMTDVSMTVSDKISKPQISSPDDIEGGVEFRLLANDNDSVIYWGYVPEDDYWDGIASYLRAGNKDKWNTSELGLHYETDSSSAVAQIKEAGDFVLYAVAVEGKKSSAFSIQLISVDSIPESYIDNIELEDGEIDGIGSGSRWDTYLSLSPDMTNAVEVSDGPAPAEFVGKTVYIQLRNMSGAADSEIVERELTAPVVPSPTFTFQDVYGGKQIFVSVNLSVGGRMGYSRGNTSVIPDGVTVFYTTDGEDPIVGESSVYDSNTGIQLKSAGSYVIKAIAEYRGGISPIGEAAVRVEQVETPDLYISGLDISAPVKEGTLSVSIDGEQPLNYGENAYMVLSESYVGKNISAEAVLQGKENSQAFYCTVTSFDEFQNSYSMDESRQFGYWRVDMRDEGQPILVGRFPKGDDQYVAVAAELDEDGEITAVAISSPFDGSLANLNYILTRPAYLEFSIGEESYSFTPISGLTSGGFAYSLYVADTQAEELFSILNGEAPFEIVMTLRETVNAVEALSMVTAAYQYYDSEAAMKSMVSDLGLESNEFVFSNEGLKDAIAYYKENLTK